MMSSFYRTELVDLTLSLFEENKHLKADKEALIAGQETLQKYLAIIEANGISVEKYKDSINCLEKACDELKEALKKKDAELKAVRHYYNECLKDLKKAHAEIEILKKNPPRFILTDDESFASLTQKLPKLNPLVMSSDNASIVCIDADQIKADAIKECLDKVAVFCAESGLFHCEADEMLLFNYLDSLKMQAMLKANGMAGDTE